MGPLTVQSSYLQIERKDDRQTVSVGRDNVRFCVNSGRESGHGNIDANDPSATWTAEIFQRKLTVEFSFGSCKPWDEQCGGAISFKGLLPFRQHGHLRCARSNREAR